MEIPSGSSWFCFDTGSNVHIVGDRHSFVHLEDIVPENLAADVKGVAQSMVTQAEGIGTVKIVSIVQDKEVELFIDGVLYVPGATHGLLSMGLALEQGFEVDYDRATRVYSVHKDGEHVIEARPAQAIWVFETVPASQRSSKPDGQQEGRAIVNYTVADGVGSLQVWHERLAHTCAQYLKVMVDRGLVNGMMLSQRQAKACDACHVGKQKQKRRRKKLNRGITAPNEVVYADLLFPGQGNGTRYKAVLVIMDGWSRFLTVHLLTNKSASTVNALIQQYVVWAERQAGRGIKKIIQREFEPTESAQFPVRQILTDKGGEFVNGAIDGWYASRGIEHIKVGPKSSHLNPCERAHQSLMEMVKAQMHASGFPRSFWPYALKNAAYIKNRVYAKPVEGVPYERMFGVKPDIHHIRKFGSLAERTVKFVAEVRVQEDVTYRDRHRADPADCGDMEWLQFTTSEPDAADTSSVGSYWVDDSIVDESDYSMGSHNEDADAYSEINTSVSQEQSDLEPTMSIRIEGGEDAGELDDAVEDADDFDDEEADDSDAVSLNEEREENQSEKASGNNLPQMSTSAENDIESLRGECGSEHGSDNNANGLVVGEDEPEQVSERHDGFDRHEQALPEGLEQREVVVLPPGMRKRTGREDTPSEVQRNQLGEDVKARRTGLREASQRRAPARYQDYVAWSNMAVRIMGKDGKPLRAQQVQVPKNRRAMLRSNHANLFLMAELEEMAAMKSKGVLEEIDQSEMPAGGRAIKTMWVYGYKTDQHGYIIRVKARLVALGNWQRPGIDFVETFAPVARMSSFRMIIALAAKLNLKVYGGDINTAYLNASLEYVKSIEGFPCAVDGHMYVVRKALYGLRQSGREWNTELNGWLLDRGFQRCATEPCLYFRYEGDTIALVLVYVDDDQGELSEYLGVEVQQNAKEVFISQRKYAKEILTKYGYDSANKCGNPMETKARLVPAGDDESVDSSYDYRGALGMLMYLATCTRPDLAYALGQLSRFVSKPTTKHVGALKRVLRYLVGTTEYGIRYLKGPADGNAAIVLQGFCDSDWASDSETRKSTSGFVFTLASGAIAWMSRRQPIIALSTAEAEYVAACEATMEATAEGNILTEILAHHTIKPVIGIDSSAAHVMATSPTYSRRTRHIELRWHYVREQVQRGSIELVKIQGEENPADAFTKPLDKARLNKLCEMMGIMHDHNVR
ncbi:hypothetical protein PR003_g19619 [Phytophthora rubi]|uniref:Integrase catalytic domain-containing protein n=1 Tax=Phytophthora rubi TaxID=129364 RepID=A0A6A4DXZ6_9STRA|nr:hypothetical protein PR003_g19619 [Phytophthora rubi]